MVVGLGGSGNEGNMDLKNKGVFAEVAGKNCVVCCRDASLQTVYMSGEDGGIQLVPQVVVSRTRPHTGGD